MDAFGEGIEPWLRADLAHLEITINAQAEEHGDRALLASTSCINFTSRIMQ